MSDAITAIDCATLLANTDAGSVDAIITSPPYSGLPGRADTIYLISELLQGAAAALAPDGSITLIVGSAPGNLRLPFHVAEHVENSLWPFKLHSLYVWDRLERLNRRVGVQSIQHDYIIHAVREGREESAPPLSNVSIIKTRDPGFNYGTGVTTPPDLAGLLIRATTTTGDLIADPFCGLCEIGVQAVMSGRRFIGGDIDKSCMTIAARRLTAAVEART